MVIQLPLAVESILEEYVSAVATRMPGLMEGLYLHGSVALDAFDERFSDIDFITILGRRAGKAEVEALAGIHRRLEREYPNAKLEGIYLQWQDLGCFPEDIEPYPCYHDGRMLHSGHFEANSITWWILKNRGVTLIGPDPKALSFTVDWQLLIGNMATNLNTYWLDWMRNPSKIMRLLGSDGFQWAVLGISRLLYTFQEGEIVSKERAGEYALTQVPPEWQRPIQEALNIRRGSRESLYMSRLVRAKHALGFLKYVIAYCNGLYAKV